MTFTYIVSPLKGVLPEKCILNEIGGIWAMDALIDILASRVAAKQLFKNFAKLEIFTKLSSFSGNFMKIPENKIIDFC